MTWNGNPAKNISSTNMLTNKVFDPSAVPLHRNRPPGPLCTCPSSPGPLCGTPVAIAFLPLGTEHNPPRKLRVSSRKLRVSKLTWGGAGGPRGRARGRGGSRREAQPMEHPWAQARGVGLAHVRGNKQWAWAVCGAWGGHGIGKGNIYIYIYVYIV